MLKIAICDDNIACVEVLSKFIIEYAKTKQIRIKISNFSNPKMLIDSKNVYNVIFLDIDMGEMNGLDAAKEIRKTDTFVKIIYVTGYSDYMNIAFSVHAFGYLVKPVSKDDIFHIMDEIIIYSEPIVEEKQEIKFLFKEGIKVFPVNDILYFEYVDRKVVLHANDKGDYTLHQERISDIAKRMEIYNFAIPHKSFVVNLYQVDYIKGYNVYLIDGSIIPLSQKYSSEFRKRVDVFLKKQII